MTVGIWILIIVLAVAGFVLCRHGGVFFGIAMMLGAFALFCLTPQGSGVLPYLQEHLSAGKG